MSVEIPIIEVFNNFDVVVSCNQCSRELEASWWHGEIVVDNCVYCTEILQDEAYKDGLNEEG